MEIYNNLEVINYNTNTLSIIATKLLNVKYTKDTFNIDYIFNADYNRIFFILHIEVGGCIPYGYQFLNLTENGIITYKMEVTEEDKVFENRNKKLEKLGIMREFMDYYDELKEDNTQLKSRLNYLVDKIDKNTTNKYD